MPSHCSHGAAGRAPAPPERRGYNLAIIIYEMGYSIEEGR
jgi:hypothetical protein